MLGFRVIIFPIGLLLASSRAMYYLLQQIKRDGTPINALEKLPRFNAFLDFIGLPEFHELERWLSETKS